MMIHWLLVYMLLKLTWCQEIDNDGYKHIDMKRKLKLYEPPIEVQNYNYPDQAPPALKQTWEFLSHPWIKLQLTCSLIRIPQNPPCEHYYLEIDDGANTNKYCGEIKNLNVFSTSNKIIIKLTTGKVFGGGMIDCQIVGFNPEFTTISPPTTTKSYLDIESTEIDSSEHGITLGEKSTNCPCGWANRIPARIIGGKITDPNEFPFMAALISKEVGRPFCGGSIVSPYHVITAAHCTDKLTFYGVEGAVLVGEHDNLKDSNIVDVYFIKKIIQHEEYSNASLINDISLVLVDNEIKFNKFIGRVCLPTERLKLDHQYVKMIGWGKTNPTGQSSPVLRKIDVRIVPIRDCLDVWSMFIPEDNPKHICTYAKNKTTCQGDSGGPVVWLDPETNRYTLVALTSFGLNCSPNIPSVKTEVAAFLTWIHYNIKATSPTGRSETCNKES